VDWQEKPQEPKSTWVSMGVYCFNKDVLVEELQADADLGDQSTHDFGRDIIPRIFQRYRVFGYQYQEYWRDVGTIQSYWQAHMDLLGPRPALDLDDPDLKLRTSAPTMPPAWIGPKAEVVDSLISPGARIAGRVVRSVISPGAVIEEGAEVRDSIVQHRCVIRQGAVIDRSILDKEVTVGAGAYVGYGDDFRPNLERPDIVNTGITVIGKRATIPAGLRVGRNVVVGPGVDEELADLEELPSGASVHPTHIPLHLFV
jgi:glucose-1-phosphate adenylyltransferase